MAEKTDEKTYQAALKRLNEIGAFTDPGLDKIKIKKERPGLISLVIENNIEIKVNYPMGKQEALKLAAQLMCAFNYD